MTWGSQETETRPSTVASLDMLFEDIWNTYLAMTWERTEIFPAVFFRGLIEFSNPLRRVK